MRYVGKSLSRLRPTRQPETKCPQLKMPHALFPFQQKENCNNQEAYVKGLKEITARFELYFNGLHVLHWSAASNF